MVFVVLFHCLGIYAGICKPTCRRIAQKSGLDRRIFRLMRFFEDMSASGGTLCWEVVSFRAFEVSFGAEFRNMLRDSFGSGHGQFQAQVQESD